MIRTAFALTLVAACSADSSPPPDASAESSATDAASEANQPDGSNLDDCLQIVCGQSKSIPPNQTVVVDACGSTCTCKSNNGSSFGSCTLKPGCCDASAD